MTHTAAAPPFGWSVATRSGQRKGLVREGWTDVGRLFFAAVIIDVIYQIIVFRAIYPGQALIVATFLAIPTYVVVRGLSNRLSGSLGAGPDRGER